MEKFINTILPKQIDNNFKGAKLAQNVFLIIVVLTIARSLVHILTADGGAQTIAGIPLSSYRPVAAAAVVTIFGLWGISQLLLGIVYALVYIRYRSLIPLMYVIVLAEYSLRILVGIAKPIATTHVAPGAVADYLVVPLALVMLWFCFKRRK